MPTIHQLDHVTGHVVVDTTRVVIHVLATITIILVLRDNTGLVTHVTHALVSPTTHITLLLDHAIGLVTVDTTRVVIRA